MAQSIDSFLGDWSAAELAGDTEKIASLLSSDFTAVGPLGFILPRPAWLARHRPGGLVYQAFDLEEVQARTIGDTVVIIARNNTPGSFQGHPIPESSRATLILVSQDGQWKLAGVHLSFMAGTPGSPPLPGAGGPPQRDGDAT
jgi:ketosteroid isomerase-like protein